MSDSEKRDEAVFNAALKLPAWDRGAYLQAACGQDAQLRAQVEALFQAIGQPVDPDKTRLVSFPLIEGAGDKIGRYKLLEQIGEGGCGVVYVAEQQEPVRRRVALKVIKLGMDTREVIARFEAERQALALMDHPHIAKVLDAGATATGRPYFVMELVKGIRITDYCDQNNLSTGARLQLFIQVCHAIQHAHQKGIIHRDIKPSNILVTLHDGIPAPKVIDFGIAKATSGQTLTDKTLYTAIDQFIGTPAYMSPEQADLSSLDIDTRSDIYALGVLLYELLTGMTPFDAKRLIAAGLNEIRRIIREEDPPRPSTRISTLNVSEQTALAKRHQSELPKLRRILSGDLDWIVMKTLEKDRTRRYDTANSLAIDIQRYLNQEPVVARPPSIIYKFQKTVRRQMVQKWAVVGLLLGGLAAVLVFGSRPSKFGNILITSDPSGAVIWENDQMMGTTPYRANNIRSGKLKLRMQLEGFDPYSMPIEVSANTTTEIKAILQQHGRPHEGMEVRIVEVQGVVEIKPLGAKNWILTAINQQLRAGDGVRTGGNSRVTIKYSDQNVLSIGPMTEFVFLGPGKGIKVLTTGVTARIDG